MRPIPERIYGLREIVRILTLTPKRAAQLRRLGLLHGDSGYTFRDLLALRAAGTLLDAGASVRQINAALTAMRRQDPTLDQPLAAVRFLVDGPRLLAQSDRVRFDPRTGQTVLHLDTGGLEKAAAATLPTGMVRPLAPPVKQAETWFERAMEWDADPAQWEEAIEAYRRVVGIDPSFAAAWNNLGLLLHRMGRYDEAGVAYRSALEQDPQCREAAYNLGSLQEDRGEVEDAIRFYRRAIAMAPDYADAHFNLAGALARSGRPDEAVEHWRRYLLLDPGSSWAKIARSHLEMTDAPVEREDTPVEREDTPGGQENAPGGRVSAPEGRVSTPEGSVPE
jgi:tetratricopeptide (TPR) repeat protein